MQLSARQEGLVIFPAGFRIRARHTGNRSRIHIVSLPCNG